MSTQFSPRAYLEQCEMEKDMKEALTAAEIEVLKRAERGSEQCEAVGGTGENDSDRCRKTATHWDGCGFLCADDAYGKEDYKLISDVLKGVRK